MEIYKSYDLPCYDGRKSFYGKARVLEDRYGNRMLQSYNTRICLICTDGTLNKLDPVATSTTRRHIRSFFEHCGYPYPGNHEWDALPLHEDVRLGKGGAA